MPQIRVCLFCFKTTPAGTSQAGVIVSNPGDACISERASRASAASAASLCLTCPLIAHIKTRSIPRISQSPSQRPHLHARQPNILNNLVHIPGDKLIEKVQGLTVQRLWRVAAVSARGEWPPAWLVAYQLPLPPCRAHSVTGLCWEEQGKRIALWKREGKHSTKEDGMEQLASSSAAPSMLPSLAAAWQADKRLFQLSHVAQGQQPHPRAFQGFAHMCCSVCRPRKSSLSPYQTCRYKMLLAVLLALTIWWLWLISVEAEARVSPCQGPLW